MDLNRSTISSLGILTSPLQLTNSFAYCIPPIIWNVMMVLLFSVCISTQSKENFVLMVDLLARISHQDHGSRRKMKPACLTRWTSPHLIFESTKDLLSRKYTRLFHSFATSFVTNPSGTDLERKATPEGWNTGMYFINQNLCVIISPPWWDRRAGVRKRCSGAKSVAIATVWVKSKLTNTKTSLNRDRHARTTRCIFDHPRYAPIYQCLISILWRLVRNAG